MSYCTLFGLRPMIKKGDKSIISIGGSKRSIGSVIIQFPFSAMEMVIEVEVFLLSDNVPSLLSMKDMIYKKLKISIQDRTVSSAGRVQSLTMRNNFLIHRWTPEDMPYVLFTEAEIGRIHRTFGHTSVRSTRELLRRARGEDLDSKTRTEIAKISEECKICKRTASAPRRFKLTVGTYDLRFNTEVQVDTMWLKKPVLKMVDLSTHFMATVFIRSQ